jgi:predicted phosphodiesterase
MTKKIQYISDIHLEFYKKVPEIPVCADILVLAGDVGYPTMPIFWEFLQKISEQFKHIILVAGNHEYYHTNSAIKKRRILTINEIDELMYSEIGRRQLNNVHFLQCSSIIIDDIEFIGATLWTDIPLEKTVDVVEAMSDYSRIFIEDDVTQTVHTVSVEALNKLHREHRQFLSCQDEDSQDAAFKAKKTVFITHHMPSYTMIHEKYEGYSINCAFASDTLHTVLKKPDIWICGHSHTVYNGVIDGVHCLMNPIGYPGENKNLNWETYISIELE